MDYLVLINSSVCKDYGRLNCIVCFYVSLILKISYQKEQDFDTWH